MITFMMSMEVGTPGSELLRSNSSAAFRAATRMSLGDCSWSKMTTLVTNGGIAMMLVEYLIVGVVSFAASRSLVFLILFQLGISTSWVFIIEDGLYFKAIADLP